MNESLIWLVELLSEITSVSPSPTTTTTLLNNCTKGRLETAMPDAFMRWCQANHIAFSITEGREDFGVFDVAVQFQFRENQPHSITVAKITGGDKITIYIRNFENGDLLIKESKLDSLHEFFDDEPIYLLQLNGVHRLPKSKGSPLKDFWQILMQDKKDIILVYVFAVFGGLINLSLPLGIQAIINLITMQQMNTSWWILLIVVLIGVLFTGVTQIFQLSIIETLQQRLFFRAAFTFSSKLPKVDIEKISGNYPPELVNRFFDVLTIQKGLSKILMDFSTSTLQILFGLLLLSFYHPFFIFFGILWLIVLVAILGLTSPSGLRTSLEESKYKYKLVYWLEEVARNLVTFKLSDSQQYIFQRADTNVTGYLKARKSHFSILITQFISIVIFKFVVTGSLLIAGSMLVLQQQLNIGQFVAAEIIIILLMVSAEKLMMTMETVYDVLTSAEKLKGVTDLPEDEDHLTGFGTEELKSGYNLEMHQVSFKYHDSQKPLLEDLDFIANAGEKVVIKATGSPGKTTFLKLLAGLYHPVSGQMLLNELPLKNIRQDEWLASVGHNLDAGQIFHGTLEHNISLGRAGVSREDVMNACRLSDLMPFIQQLPHGLLTEFAAADRRLSGGFLKRIALARAIVHGPKLLILDDQLPELDNEHLQDLWNHLLDPGGNKTLVIVSDNEQLAQRATKVYRLANRRLEPVNTQKP